jgi:two-component system cell cycle sensor histidine kinase/response regulator CckA
MEPLNQDDSNSARVDGLQLLKSTLDQITTGICFVDHDWRFRFASSTAQFYLGLPAAALLGNSIWELFPEALGSDFERAYRCAMEERRVAKARGYFEPLETWFEATAYPIDQGIAFHLLDVTEEQERLLELEALTQRLGTQAALLDAVLDAIYVEDFEHRVSYWNRGSENLYGWTFDEMQRASTRSLLYDDPTELDLATDQLVRIGKWTGELKQTTRDGRHIIVDCRWQLLRDTAGRPVAILGVNSDVTDQKKEREHGFRIQRMEGLGTLAGGIAHDLNNVFTPILMASQILGTSEPDERRRELLKAIEINATRGASMVGQLLSFARGQEGEREVVDVRKILRSLESICRDTLPKAINVTIDFENGLSRVICDETQILQVLVNLVTNARDAMAEHGGDLGIRANNVEFAGRTDIQIRVEDTGHGMDAETASRVFEPFFTTKAVGSGTGLGLSSSMTIAQTHGGQLTVESKPGQGSCFTLQLPGVAALEERSNNPTPSIELSGRGERVMIIDDEAMICRSIQHALELNGYVTITAQNGREAIRILEAENQSVDLVVTDMMMPVVDGATTVKYISENYPETAVIVTSGISTDHNLGKLEQRVARILSKPFSHHCLLSAVRGALDTHVGAGRGH